MNRTPPAKKRASAPSIIETTDYQPPADDAALPADLAHLQICHNEPLPSPAARGVSKYAPVFERMKFGDSIKIADPKEKDRIVKAMQKFLALRDIEGHARACSNYAGTGYCRVWLMPGSSRSSSRAKR